MNYKSIKDISKEVKNNLIKEFPNYKFSVSKKSYSGGQSLTVRVMSGPAQLLVDDTKYYQINQYYIETSDKLTDLGKRIAQKMYEISSADNWDNSDPMTDYYNVNYYLHLSVGAWDKPYQVIEANETTVKEFEQVEVKAGQVQIVDYSEKAIAIIGDTKPIKDKLKELGGKFNFRLSCGAGWIFPKTKLAIVTAALSKGSKELIKEELNEEIQQTVEFFKQSDVTIYGEIQESTKEIEQIYQQEEVKQYSTLKDISEAAQSGEMISLCNLAELVNKK